MIEWGEGVWRQDPGWDGFSCCPWARYSARGTTAAPLLLLAPRLQDHCKLGGQVASSAPLQSSSTKSPTKIGPYRQAARASGISIGERSKPPVCTSRQALHPCPLPAPTGLALPGTMGPLARVCQGGDQCLLSSVRLRQESGASLKVVGGESRSRDGNVQDALQAWQLYGMPGLSTVYLVRRASHTYPTPPSAVCLLLQSCDVALKQLGAAFHSLGMAAFALLRLGTEVPTNSSIPYMEPSLSLGVVWHRAL